MKNSIWTGASPITKLNLYHKKKKGLSMAKWYIRGIRFSLEKKIKEMGLGPLGMDVSIM